MQFQENLKSKYSLSVLDVIFQNSIINTRNFHELTQIDTKRITTRILHSLVDTGILQLAIPRSYSCNLYI